MRAFVPMCLLTLIVALETDLISVVNRRLSMLGKDDVADLHRELHVGRTGAMTALALFARSRTLWIIEIGVGRIPDAHHLFTLVAFETGRCSLSRIFLLPRGGYDE